MVRDGMGMENNMINKMKYWILRVSEKIQLNTFKYYFLKINFLILI